MLRLGLIMPHYWSQTLPEYPAQSLVTFSSLTGGKRPWARLPPRMALPLVSLLVFLLSGISVFLLLSFDAWCPVFWKLYFVCFVWFSCGGGGGFRWEGKPGPVTLPWGGVGILVCVFLRAPQETQQATRWEPLYRPVFSAWNVFFLNWIESLIISSPPFSLCSLLGTSVRWILHRLILHLLTFLSYFPFPCHFALQPERCLKLFLSHTFLWLKF